MAKSLFIAEKPSVAQEFAKALKEKMKSWGWVSGIRFLCGDLVCRSSCDHELSGGL